MKKSKLRADVVAEPLVNQWYAWSYLIPPATHARYLTESQLPIMESFVENPQVHVDALKDPEMAGGPFIQYAPERADEVKDLLEKTKTEQKHLLLLSKSISQLEAMLDAHPQGGSLEALYPHIPIALRGFVELVYDARDTPSIRFIEGLIYNSEYYQASGQGFGLHQVPDVDARAFVMSTPTLTSDLECYLNVPFDDPRVDRLFRTRDEADSVDELAEEFQLTGKDRESFSKLFTDTPSPSPKRYDGDGVRIRYLGHACVLIETAEVSIICDPLVSNPNPQGIARYSYVDLPDTIDFAMMTHNHQDHVMFETLFQLRHKIKNFVIPTGQKGSLIDPNLRMTLEKIGFRRVIGIEELESIPIPGGEIISLPVYGEHGDLNIATKNAYWVKVLGRSVICAADSNNVDNSLYQHLLHLLGKPDILFLGMECEGAPYTWSYGPLLPHAVKHQQSQSRRLDGSNCERAIELIETMCPTAVYVYAMGMEPWLTYITSISYADDSPPILESNKFISECQKRGLPSERLNGRKEIVLTRNDGETRQITQIAIPPDAYNFKAPALPKRATERSNVAETASDPQAEQLTKLLGCLRELNVRVSVEDDQLKCNAPQGVLTPELTAKIKQHKSEIITLLKGVKRESPIDEGSTS
ncbi:MAG: polyketide synthase [Planctomycetaceae bacterium]|nr:polyketide synthase [Planctomycetaceae bacterium]